MSHEMIAHAKRFFEQFGTGEITVEDFDKFIIDNELAVDPETDNVKAPSHKAFVQERNAAKRSLNSAATHLYGDAYQIIVIKPGISYEVKSWAQAADNDLGNIGDVVRKFTSNKTASLRTLKNTAENLMRDDPNNRQYEEAFQVLSMVEAEGRLLRSRVDAMTLHYEAGVDSAREYAKARIQQIADNVISIEDKSA